MCKSISEGGRRCNGRHLSLDDHRNRAERRRDRDRKRKQARRGAPALATLPEFPTCEYPRPSDIPEGYLHQSQLRDAGIDKVALADYRRAHPEFGKRTSELPRGTSISPWWVAPSDLAGALADPTWGDSPEPTEREKARTREAAEQAAAKAAAEKATPEVYKIGNYTELRYGLASAAVMIRATGEEVAEVRREQSMRRGKRFSRWCLRRASDFAPIGESFSTAAAMNAALKRMDDLEPQPHGTVAAHQAEEIAALRAAHLEERRIAEERKAEADRAFRDGLKAEVALRAEAKRQEEEERRRLELEKFAESEGITVDEAEKVRAERHAVAAAEAAAAVSKLGLSVDYLNKLTYTGAPPAMWVHHGGAWRVLADVDAIDSDGDILVTKRNGDDAYVRVGTPPIHAVVPYRGKRLALLTKAAPSRARVGDTRQGRCEGCGTYGHLTLVGDSSGIGGWACRRCADTASFA
ncbi:Uncharacterised protein [Mycobacteroides abscessus]|uniref:hypothetical protein n=1 Tax=Mycobacteroides abscessus TaxID=36809 RepID=UPI0005E34356|nr:hypothetical protein [Mycobacteroides abscessus]CPX20652.1 Uncharacterised protein [Mycobacteroides abscessus]CRG61236.1 Uncharacterised protein [Mycobacteroides abscessus]